MEALIEAILAAARELARNLRAAVESLLASIAAARESIAARKASTVRRRDADTPTIYLYYGAQCWDVDPYPYRRVPYRD